MFKELLAKLHLQNTCVDYIYRKYLVSYNSKRIKHKSDKKQHKLMDKYGLDALEKIYSICLKNKVNIWFEYGTLLGAYREKGFIPYDYDIDLSIYKEDYTPRLVRDLFNEGFTIRRLFYKVKNMDPSDREMTEFTLCFKGVFIDVFLNFKKRNKRIIYWYTDFLGAEFSERNIYSAQRNILDIAPFEKINFLGIKFPIPVNAKECLEKIYGKTFMTPIRDWVSNEPDSDLPYKEIYGEMIGAW